MLMSRSSCSRVKKEYDKMVMSRSSSIRVMKGCDRMVLSGCCSNRVEQESDRMVMSRSSCKRVEQYVYQQGVVGVLGCARGGCPCPAVMVTGLCRGVARQ